MWRKLEKSRGKIHSTLRDFFTADFQNAKRVSTSYPNLKYRVIFAFQKSAQRKSFKVEWIFFKLFGIFSTNSIVFPVLEDF